MRCGNAHLVAHPAARIHPSSWEHADELPDKLAINATQKNIAGDTPTQTDGFNFGVTGRDANDQNTDVFSVHLRRPAGDALMSFLGTVAFSIRSQICSYFLCDMYYINVIVLYGNL
jgi:hypothetical protein